MTTRFLTITDTHWGALPDKGYAVQPRVPALFEPLHAALKQWLANQPEPIDFILHNGDVVDAGTEPQIINAVQKLGELGPRVLVCLGNHDLEQSGSFALWQQHHNGLLADDSGSYRVAFKDFDLYVMAHHWHQIDPPHYWNRKLPPQPLLDPAQRKAFEQFASNATRPVVLTVHALVLGVPTSQSGLEEEFHKPDPAWRQTILDYVEQYPAISLVLTGHNHIHTLGRHREAVIVSTTALTEPPYQARLITISDGHFDMNTVRLEGLLNVPTPAIRPENAYVIGGDEQCSASWDIRF